MQARKYCQSGAPDGRNNSVRLAISAAIAPSNQPAGVKTPTIRVAKLLIEAGADIEALNTEFRTTPLMEAARANAAGVVELLVVGGADIDAKLSSGPTALHFATNVGAAHAVQKLIDLGADVNAASETEPDFPSTPLAMAIAQRRDEIADILREAGASE